MLVPVLAVGYGAWRFGRAPENEASAGARGWASADRRFTDDALGLTLDIPEGWVGLKPGNSLVAAPAEARLTLAQREPLRGPDRVDDAASRVRLVPECEVGGRVHVNPSLGC